MRRYILLTMSFLVCWAGSCLAQGQFSRSYVTPFPKGDTYTVYVAGASLAQGLYSSLNKTFSKDRKLEAKNRVKNIAGLARQKAFNWTKELDALAAREKMDILVIFLGLKELATIRQKGKRFRVGSEQWKNILGKRVNKLLATLKKKRVAIYWVGMPIMRSPELNSSMQILNDVFRKHAFINGVKFIDTWKGFADQFGRYSAFGPDINGKVRRLRANNGVSFSGKGYQKLAHFVEKEIRRDITIAKSERNIPLAGSIEEQSRITKDISRKPKIARRYSANKKTEEKPKEEEGFFTRLQRNLIGGSQNKSTKKEVKQTKVGGIDIVRPPISDLTFAAIKNSPGSLNAVTSDIIANNVGKGLTALASVTSSNDLSLKDVKQRVPVKQTPYYRVLIKGETLKPKPGRADDFSWSQ